MFKTMNIIYSTNIFVNLALLLSSCTQTLTLNCGIWNRTASNFLDPTRKIITGDFLDNLPINATIWEAPTMNVTAAAGTGDSHFDYISGYRYTTRYIYVANEKTIDFLDNFRPPVAREVKFTCNDGSSVTYRFEFPIKTSDVKEPIFHQEEYEFSISQEWPLNRPINFHSFIVAWDDDDDFRNSVLRFEIDNLSSPMLGVSLKHTPLWDESDPTAKPPAAYRIDLFLDNSSPPLGDYSLKLVGHSRRLTSSVDVFIKVN